jgi:hypothetical protein
VGFKKRPPAAFERALFGGASISDVVVRVCVERMITFCMGSRFVQDKAQRPIIKERVEGPPFECPEDADKTIERLTQTYLEQVNVNQAFRKWRFASRVTFTLSPWSGRIARLAGVTIPSEDFRAARAYTGEDPKRRLRRIRTVL